jgi:hypothetical protein
MNTELIAIIEATLLCTGYLMFLAAKNDKR